MRSLLALIIHSCSGAIMPRSCPSLKIPITGLTPNVEDMINSLAIPAPPDIHEAFQRLDLAQVDQEDADQARKHKKTWLSSSFSFGQDKSFIKVCDFLTNGEVGMVCIYGMGGVGKTTLMKKIWKEFLEPSGFKVIWVVVSQKVDLHNIREEIMVELNVKYHPRIPLSERSKQISEALKKQKIALLLDDVWESMDLEELKILDPIGLDMSNFKIVFTTRSEEVCNRMQPHQQIKLECLGWDDSWALFEKNAGSKSLNSDYRIEGLAKMVAKECKGLPLALAVIGRAMACKYTAQAWEHALTTLQNAPANVVGAEEKLFSRLKLSYDFLPGKREKNCFLYCCLYPKESKIEVGKLVKYWISDGLLDMNGSFTEAGNQGHDIVETLQASCLLEKDSRLGYVKMHDVLRDLGLWIVSKKKLTFFVLEGFKLSGEQMTNVWRTAHEMYILNGSKLPEQPLCLNLSTLIFDDAAMKIKIANAIFKSMCRLRVLEMTGVEFLDEPVAIGQLKEPRYLSIMYTNLKRLPDEVGNLCKLEVLRLSYNHFEFIELPETIGQLVELRVLTVNDGLRQLPKELRNLKKLEVLDVGSFLLPVQAIPFGIFGNMNELRTLHLDATSFMTLPMDVLDSTKLEDLFIRFESRSCQGNQVLGPCHVDLIMEDLCKLSATLKHLFMTNWPITSCHKLLSAVHNMGNLSKLHVNGFPLNEFLFHSRQCLSGLQELHISYCSRLDKIQFSSLCLSNLKLLSISFCGRIERIDIDHACLQNLRVLDITGCKSIKYFCGLHYLQSIVELRVDGGQLDGELITEEHVCFRKLQVLQLYNFKLLNSICNENTSFPSITQFSLRCCPKLAKLPRGLMNEGRTLQTCEIVGEKEWRERLLAQDDGLKCFLLLKFPFLDHDDGMRS